MHQLRLLMLRQKPKYLTVIFTWCRYPATITSPLGPLYSRPYCCLPYTDFPSDRPTNHIHPSAQVLHDVWATIIVVNPHDSLIVVAPFDGIQAPPYRGQPRIDSRDLYYDPRGWWRHMPALANTTPVAPGRLHRLARGLSASGLSWGAGSLNKPLENVRVNGPWGALTRCTSDGERGREDDFILHNALEFGV